MPKFIGGAPPFIGTQDNLTIYFMKGEYIVRTKSSLTGKRVKRDPAFAKTMMYAGWLKQGSRIASHVYKQLPDDKRVYKQYRELTGKAMLLLKEGFDQSDVVTMLETVYVLSQPAENTTGKDGYSSSCHEFEDGRSSEDSVEYSAKYCSEYPGGSDSANSSRYCVGCCSQYIGGNGSEKVGNILSVAILNTREQAGAA